MNRKTIRSNYVISNKRTYNTNKTLLEPVPLKTTPNDNFPKRSTGIINRPVNNYVKVTYGNFINQPIKNY